MEQKYVYTLKPEEGDEIYTHEDEDETTFKFFGVSDGDGGYQDTMGRTVLVWCNQNLPIFRYIPIDDKDVPIFLDSLTITDRDNGLFGVEVSYKATVGNDAGVDFCKITISTRSRSVRKFRSFVRKSISYSDGFLDNAPNTEATMIGVTESGSQGVSVPEPSLEFSVTNYIVGADVTAAFVKTMHALSAGVNDAPFLTFPAGSLMFVDFETSGHSFQIVPLKMRFSAKPNINQPDPPFANLIADGWDHVDYRSVKTVKTVNGEKKVTSEVDVREVHQHIKRINMNLLPLECIT